MFELDAKRYICASKKIKNTYHRKKNKAIKELAR